MKALIIMMFVVMAVFQSQSYGETRTFEGMIDGKNPLVMTLEQSGIEVDGEYQYKEINQPPSHFTGLIKNDGTIVLVVFNADDQATAVYKGSRTDNGYSGKVRMIGKNILGDYGVTDRIFDLTEVKTYSETYVDDSGTASLSMNRLKDGHIEFSISVGTDNGCTGMIEGSTKITTQRTAKFVDSDTGCTLTFKFGTAQVDIEETNCSAAHGMRCVFSGIYKKQ